MEGEHEPGDVVELGRDRRFRLPGWRPSRGASVLAVAALVVGLAAGYAAGDRQARGGAAPAPTTPSASSSPRPTPDATFLFTGSPALTQDTGACSTQTGDEIQLGVQVTNQSTAPLTLQTAKAVVPMGGLKQLTGQWAPCGTIPIGLSQPDDILLPGDSTWLTVTFKVQVRCPTPYPVQFTVGYLTQGHPGTASLPGFPDLSQVPYSGCPANTAGSFNSVTITATSAP